MKGGGVCEISNIYYKSVSKVTNIEYSSGVNTYIPPLPQKKMWSKDIFQTIFEYFPYSERFRLARTCRIWDSFLHRIWSSVDTISSPISSPLNIHLTKVTFESPSMMETDTEKRNFCYRILCLSINYILVAHVSQGASFHLYKVMVLDTTIRFVEIALFELDGGSDLRIQGIQGIQEIQSQTNFMLPSSLTLPGNKLNVLLYDDSTDSVFQLPLKEDTYSSYAFAYPYSQQSNMKNSKRKRVQVKNIKVTYPGTRFFDAGQMLIFGHQIRNGLEQHEFNRDQYETFSTSSPTSIKFSCRYLAAQYRDHLCIWNRTTRKIVTHYQCPLLECRWKSTSKWDTYEYHLIPYLQWGITNEYLIRIKNEVKIVEPISNILFHDLLTGRVLFQIKLSDYLSSISEPWIFYDKCLIISKLFILEASRFLVVDFIFREGEYFSLSF
jgi:hypothetical protein